MDEIWSNDNVRDAKAAPATAGDVWTWTALCADTKLIVELAARRSRYGYRSGVHPRSGKQVGELCPANQRWSSVVCVRRGSGVRGSSRLRHAGENLRRGPTSGDPVQP